jgi:hypothetical protein
MSDMSYLIEIDWELLDPKLKHHNMAYSKRSPKKNSFIIGVQRNNSLSWAIFTQLPKIILKDIVFRVFSLLLFDSTSKFFTGFYSPF